MRVAVVSREFLPLTPWGGCAVVNTSLARGLAAKGHTCVVVTQAIRSNPNPVSEEMGVEVHHVGNNPSRWSARARADFIYHASWEVWRLRDRIDIVQSDLWSGEGIAAILAGLPLVLFTQAWEPLPGSGDEPEWRSWRYRTLTLAASLVAHRAAAIGAHSHSSVRALTRRWPTLSDRTVLVPLSIDLDAMNGGRPTFRATLGLAEHDVLFGYVGRLQPNKGVADLIEAIARVSMEYPAARCVLVGSDALDPTAQAWRSRIRARNLDGRVILLGQLPSTAMPDLYASVDVLVFPSHGENFGLVVAEALSAGASVIASDTGLASELQINEPGLQIVDVVSPESLSGPIAKMLRLGRPAIQAMRPQLRVEAEQQLSRESLVDAVENLYESVLAARGGVLRM